MHIGIDARLPAFRAGGISEYVRHLIDALAQIETSQRFTIFHAAHDPTLRFPETTANMSRANLITPCHHPFERLLLSAELKPFDLDVLHSPDTVPPMTGARRRVITVHDQSVFAHPEHLLPDAVRHYRGQMAWALESADAVAASSRHTRQQILSRFPTSAAKVVTVPLAAGAGEVDAHDPAAVAATLRSHNLTPGFVLFVGTIEPRKNLLTLIRACERLHATGAASASLVVAGERGWLCDDVIDAMDRSPAHVRRLGRVPADHLPHLYASAAVLAVPSIEEGFGLPVVEAMQSGCPVVASTGGALPETAGGAALLADPHDVSCWADQLRRVLAEPGLRGDLRARGLVRARDFAWTNTAAAMLALYRGE